MSDDTMERDTACRECGQEATTLNEGICSGCAAQDEWVKCDFCGEQGWAGCDNMFTFHCKERETEICESCSSNNLCEDCEGEVDGIVTFR